MAMVDFILEHSHNIIGISWSYQIFVDMFQHMAMDANHVPDKAKIQSVKSWITSNWNDHEMTVLRRSMKQVLTVNVNWNIATTRLKSFFKLDLTVIYSWFSLNALKTTWHWWQTEMTIIWQSYDHECQDLNDLDLSMILRKWFGNHQGIMMNWNDNSLTVIWWFEHVL